MQGRMLREKMSYSRMDFGKVKITPRDYLVDKKIIPLNGHTHLCACGLRIGEDFLICGPCELSMKTAEVAKKYRRKRKYE